jgi:hypothetical protein
MIPASIFVTLSSSNAVTEEKPHSLEAGIIRAGQGRGDVLSDIVIHETEENPRQ